MQRSAWLLQLIGLAVMAYIVVTYCKAGQGLVKTYKSSMEAMHLRTIAGVLATCANPDDESEGGYPTGYSEFKKLLKEEMPGAGRKPWLDRWGKEVWYSAFTEQGVQGFWLGSAGPDKGWKTGDDLLICCWGDKRWTKNLGWLDEESQTRAGGSRPAGATATDGIAGR